MLCNFVTLLTIAFNVSHYPAPADNLHRASSFASRPFVSHSQSATLNANPNLEHWDTMGLGHDETGTQYDWYTMGLGHNRTGTQYSDTMGYGHNYNRTGA